VLEHFTDGLRDAGHTSEVIDLYAIKFDPVFRDRDVPSYTDGDMPADLLELHDVRAQVMASCRGPLQRWLAARALRGKTLSEIAAGMRSQMPKDVLAQQERSPGPTGWRSSRRSTSAASRRSSRAGSTGCGPLTSRSG
jgi:NAD(P)H dehydrogenase (quinone)